MNGKRKIKDIYNNCYATDEILWMLEGNEKLSAFEFVCKNILNIEPESFLDVFEYEEE